MPKKPRAIPRFKTEAEEAEWWDAHPEVATAIMKRAIKSGKARRGPRKIGIVPQAARQTALDARLLRIHFPGMDVDNQGHTLRPGAANSRGGVPVR